ncbi:hypothetical protein Plhal304r1_c019g0068411 [Plasmopara halstedii]
MYKEFRVNLSHAQALKVLHGKPVRLTHAQLNAGHAHYFGPETYKKLVKAYESGKGTTLHMPHGEVLWTHQSGLDILELCDWLKLCGVLRENFPHEDGRGRVGVRGIRRRDCVSREDSEQCESERAAGEDRKYIQSREQLR